MNRILALCVITVVLTGCSSMPFSPFTAPRVSGRVLDAETRAPLADVKVFSGRQAGGPRVGVPPKGGELLMMKAPARRDQQGRFTLETERVLTPFRNSGWFSVQLRLERSGYESYRTNYSRLNLKTNAPPREPFLDAGEIPLQPAPKE